jgi:hypothetical protein
MDSSNFILISLIVSTTVPSALAQFEPASGCSFKKFGEQLVARYEGNSIGSRYHLSSLEHCQDFCNEKSECNSFAYCPFDSSCHAKDQVLSGHEDTLLHDGGCTTYFRSCLHVSEDIPEAPYPDLDNDNWGDTWDEMDYDGLRNNEDNDDNNDPYAELDNDEDWGDTWDESDYEGLIDSEDNDDNNDRIPDADITQCSSINVSGAGTSEINGVYKMIPNLENADVTIRVHAGFQQSQLIRSWQYATFQLYCFTTNNGDLYWRMSDTNPLRYFYKGPGDHSGVRDWVYQAGERGNKPNPIIACYNDEGITSSCRDKKVGCTNADCSLDNEKLDCRQTCNIC